MDLIELYDEEWELKARDKICVIYIIYIIYNRVNRAHVPYV